MSQTENSEPARILRYPEVFKRTGYHRTSLFKMERAGKFPKRIPLGPKSVGWLESEINAWIADRLKARDAAPATAAQSTSSVNASNQPALTKRGRGRPPVNPPQHPAY